jgi:hypothetical protein
LIVTCIILKLTWYDKLGPGEMYMTKTGAAPPAEPVGGFASTVPPGGFLPPAPGRGYGGTR